MGATISKAVNKVLKFGNKDGVSSNMGDQRLPPRGSPGYSTERRQASLNILVQHWVVQTGKLFASKVESNDIDFNVKHLFLTLLKK